MIQGADITHVPLEDNYYYLWFIGAECNFKTIPLL